MNPTNEPELPEAPDRISINPSVAARYLVEDRRIGDVEYVLVSASPEATQQAKDIVGTVFKNTAASPETLERVMIERISASLTAAAERQSEPHCWHCGVVLAYVPKLRCEDCPTECDVEGCNQYGCADQLEPQRSKHK